ncbi:MAG TPA: methylated-DNA--[protein]-cysteine S-methyltransferase [Burkholderiales bacterium]|jgi:AraC family transcriptional regulator of adaptative response/methylated-DNA-[protein]-cysteine methyltransferase|nr:methylated-DNA--[protein]-cysteine S-methyltransferase [Burkholderiales bacterium]
MEITEKARSYLDARRGERVTLEELASALGASPFHLQRRFKEAFGVSPRAYQEAHRVEAVKSSLRNGSRVTEAVFEAGYGSVSRFYEKAASRLGMGAAEYRAKGKGKRIAFCTFPSPLGVVLVGATERGLCSVKLGADARVLARLLREEFSGAQVRKDAAALKSVKSALLAFLSGDDRLARLPLDIRGTVFQRRVWDALLRIPRGETRTYAELARSLGAPAAVRAVGSACGANPVALVIPCHRALRTDGGLGGYAWGLGRKERLLKMERGNKK